MKRYEKDQGSAPKPTPAEIARRWQEGRENLETQLKRAGVKGVQDMDNDAIVQKAVETLISLGIPHEKAEGLDVDVHELAKSLKTELKKSDGRRARHVD